MNRYFTLLGCLLASIALLNCNAQTPQQAALDSGENSDTPQELATTAPTPVFEHMRTLTLFDEAGWGMAMSADGKRMITAGHNKDDMSGVQWIIVYNMENNKKLHEYESSSPGLVPVAISTDGKMASYLMRSGRVKIIEVDTGQDLFEFEDQILSTYGSYLLRFSADSKSIWTNVQPADKPSSLLHWSLETKESLPTLTVEKRRPNCFRVFPDGRHVVAGYRNGDIRIWELESGSSTLLAEGGAREPPIGDFAKNSIANISVSPDGKQVVSKTEDRNPILWDVASGKQIREVECHASLALNLLEFDPTGRLLLCQGGWPSPYTGTGPMPSGYPIHVFDVQSGERLALLTLSGSDFTTQKAYSIGWGDEERLLYVAMSSGKMHVFDTTPWLKKSSE